MSTLTTLTASLRIDVKDGSSAVWSDAQLQRPIAKAVGDFNQAAPILASATKNGVDSQRRYDFSATTGLMWVHALEYPIDQDPRSLLPFQEETKGVLYIIGSSLPSTGTNTVKGWYAKVHTVDASGSTIPAELEELLLLGAFGYALQELASLSTTSINASSWTPRQAASLAASSLAEYRKRLAQVTNQRAATWWMPSWGAVPSSWDTI